MRQFKNNIKRNRGRNHSDRSFKRVTDVDRLIGNFAKVYILANQPVNFKNTFKVASKYIDNAGVNNLEELKKFLWVYRNSYDNKLIQIKSEIKVKSRDLISSKLISNKKTLGVLKNIYQRF